MKTLGVSLYFIGQDTQTSWGKDQTSGNTSLLNKVHLIMYFTVSMVFRFMNSSHEWADYAAVFLWSAVIQFVNNGNDNLIMVHW